MKTLKNLNTIFGHADNFLMFRKKETFIVNCCAFDCDKFVFNFILNLLYLSTCQSWNITFNQLKINFLSNSSLLLSLKLKTHIKCCAYVLKIDTVLQWETFILIKLFSIFLLWQQFFSNVFNLKKIIIRVQENPLIFDTNYIINARMILW